MKKSNINFSVKLVYFNAIEKGTKTIEYRSASNDYWMRKLVDMERYPGKTVDEIRSGIERGQLELYPIQFDTCTFWTVRDGRKISIVVKWRDTKLYEGHSTFAIFLGDMVRDAEGKEVKPKNR